MILGIGTDIVEVERIAKSIENESFKRKVFSANEINYCDKMANKAQHYAARFAAKEAFVKALGTGLRDGLTMNEMEVINDDKGKPHIQLSGQTALTVSSKNIHSIHLSLSHIAMAAIAMVVIEG